MDMGCTSIGALLGFSCASTGALWDFDCTSIAALLDSPLRLDWSSMGLPLPLHGGPMGVFGFHTSTESTTFIGPGKGEALHIVCTFQVEFPHLRKLQAFYTPCRAAARR